MRTQKCSDSSTCSSRGLSGAGRKRREGGKGKERRVGMSWEEMGGGRLGRGRKKEGKEEEEVDEDRRK